jgi:hypothetical protein
MMFGKKHCFLCLAFRDRSQDLGFRCALFMRVRDNLFALSVDMISCERPVQCLALGARGIIISADLESLTTSIRSFYVAGCKIPLLHNPMESVHTSETSMYFAGLNDIASRKTVQPVYARANIPGTIWLIRAVIFNSSVRAPPDVISLQLCTRKVVGSRVSGS